MILHKKRYRVIPFVLSLLIIAFGVVWMFRTSNKTKGEATFGIQQKLTVAEFREKRQEFKEKYPAIPVWDNSNEAETVKMLNYNLEKTAQDFGEDKSRDELLAEMNRLLEKWGDPEKSAALRKATETLLKEVPKDRQKSEQERRQAMEIVERASSLVKVSEADIENSHAFFEEVMAMIAARREKLDSRMNQEPSPPDLEKLDSPGDALSGSIDGHPIEIFPPRDFDQQQSHGQNVDIPDNIDIPAFDPNQWQRGFLSQVLDWNDDFDTQYLDVVTAPYFSQEEFEEFFPTESAREILKDRQDQMQADIARRVQGVLGEDTGNREEKLSIIRQTLSENWSPDIADGVLERLK